MRPAVTELDDLIADPARDMASFRMGGIEGGTRVSLDAVPDVVIYGRRRMLATDPRHGTETLYQRSCRCRRCKAAHAAYRRERRRAGLERS